MRTSSRALRRFVLAAGAALLLAWPGAASANEYDPERAGHPLRIAAYVLHPVGFTLDWLLFRPVHWVGSQPGLRAFFGHSERD